MTYFYQVMNFQHQSVDTFQSLIEAKERIETLQKTYGTEMFYVITLTIPYIAPAPKAPD